MGHDLSRFHALTEGVFRYQAGASTHGFGVTILSKTSMQKHIGERGRIRARAVTAEVHLAEKPLFLTCAHLGETDLVRLSLTTPVSNTDYRNEPLRHRELNEMSFKLSDLLEGGRDQIWCGDFNALTREDYDQKTWDEIAAVRRNNRWESPQTGLTSRVSENKKR